MFGCFVLEVLTGAEPWAHKQTLPGELQYYRATHPTANPLDDAINDGVFASIVAGGTDTDQFRKVIVLLRLCFAYDASKRPSMTTVLATLSSIAEDTSSASRALYDTLSLDPPAGPPLKPSPTVRS